MKCPYQKKIFKSEKTDYANEAQTTDVEITFGECVRSECPFFEIGQNYCRRTIM